MIYFLYFLVVILVLFPCVVTANASDFVFETEYIRYVISSDGTALSLKDKQAGIEFLGPQHTPLASITIRGQSYPSSQIVRDGEILRVLFGSSGFTANYRLSNKRSHILIELISVEGELPDAFHFMELTTVPLENCGDLLAVRWDAHYSICLMALSDRVHSKLSQTTGIVSTVYPEFGMDNQRVAFIAVPTGRFLNSLEEIEREYRLPSPRLDGYWAKASPYVHTNYLFIDLSESNIDEVIRYATLGGFQYILVYCSSWASSFGSYPINRKNFPRGEESLKAAIDKCHAAGLKVGMHMMTSLVSKADPLVRPIPDRRLLKEGESTLAHDLGEADRDLVTTTDLCTSSPEYRHHSLVGEGIDIRIDNEIIRCRHVGGLDAKTLADCTRAFAGTKSAFHKAGTRVQRLVQRYGSYLVDLKTSLKNELADRIAGLINRCGFDMIYFDGGEANNANGPGWYWISQQQMSVWDRVQREILVQGSGMTHWTWHIFSRATCDDFAALASKEYLDHHKIKNAWYYLTRNLMPAELGWWGLLVDTYDHLATLPDEIEHLGVRMLALGSPVSVETTLQVLKKNGRTEKILGLLSAVNHLRLSRTLTQERRDKLRTGAWRIIADKSEPRFHPSSYETKRVELPSEIEFYNPFGTQPIQFRLRIVPSPRKTGDAENIVLFRPKEPLKLDLPAPGERKHGSLIKQVDLTKYDGRPLDLHRHRGLAITLRADGLEAKTDEQNAVLNIQLESADNMYRDYYVDLNFHGDKVFIIPETNVERLLPEFSPAIYNQKKSLYTFDYTKVVGLNLRWMRLPETHSFTCYISQAEALAEDDIVLKKFEVSLGKANLVIASELHSGDYVEFCPEKGIHTFDRNGVLLSTFATPPTLPFLEHGWNKIILSAVGPGQIRWTTMVLSETPI